MDKVCLQQNRTTKDIYLYINMQDLELASISPTFLSQIANSAGRFILNKDARDNPYRSEAVGLLCF